MLYLQDKEKIIKDFYFYNNADEMKKKSVFETADFLFFREGRCDGERRYWICGKEQKYHIIKSRMSTEIYKLFISYLVT